MKKPIRNKSEEDRLAQLILDAPSHWKDNQDLLLNRAMLGLQLIAFQQRLRTIALRYQDDVSLYLQNTLIKPLRSLESDLQALTQAKANHAKPGTALKVRSAYAIPTALDFEEMYQIFVTDIRDAIEELPETIRTIPEHAVQKLVDKSLDETEIVTVSLRRVVEYVLEMEFLAPVQRDLSLWPPRVRQLYTVSQDVLRLVSFQLDDMSGEEEMASADTLHPLLLKGLERLQHQLTQTEKASAELLTFVASRLNTTVEQLNPYTITRTEGNLQRYVRGHKGRQIQSRFRESGKKITDFLNESVVSLLYRRSEGVLFARQLQDTDPYSGSTATAGLQLMEAIEPGVTVLESIPLYYRQLFLDLPNITQEFWVGAEQQLKQAAEAVERWNRGIQGGLLVLGQSQSGKTALCQLIGQTHFKREEVYVLNPVPGGSVDFEALVHNLRQALGVSGDVEECFSKLPPRCVLIINDLERWWERSPDGNVLIKEMLSWIERFGRRCFIIINANMYAYKLIDRIYPITNQFLGILTRTPANARQIEEVIMLRHRSAGLQFILGEQQEQNVSAWAKARLFTSIFDYSRGNVGAALQTWIACIHRVIQNDIVVHQPSVPDLNLVDEMPPLQKAILVHMLLHGQLTFKRLQKISELEESLLQHELLVLQRMGWLQEGDQGILKINRFLMPHLTHGFAERRLI